MTNFKGLQLSFLVPAGTYSIAIANIDAMCRPIMQPLLKAVSSPHCTAVADFVRLSEGTYSVNSGMKTWQFSGQLGLWSQDWKAWANYNWLFAAQHQTIASLWTIEATVWRPTNAEDIVHWLCIGGLTIRTATEEKESTGAVTCFLFDTTKVSSQAMSGKSVRTNELAQWIEKLGSLSRLPPGWNRHGAPVPSERAIKTAQQFIEALVNDGQPPTRVAASAVGGVGVTRQIGERMAYFEFYNDGSACALLADDEAEERLLDVALDRGTVKNLLDEVNSYLNG